MDSSDNAATRHPVEKVCAEFEQRKELLEEVCTKTKSLIEDCLKDAQLRYQSVQARVKNGKKLRAKYLDPEKSYAKLDDITDQAGLRVITYYDDELDRVVELVKSEFTVIPEKSVDKRVIEPNKFGYRAINLVCTHSEKRKSDVQFKKQANVTFEVQVTSVLGHAWSEIEHDWYDLKETYPAYIKRRFSRLAALFELAESEFVSLRDQRTSYRRSVGVQVEAELPDVPVDAVSLKAFTYGEPIVAQVDERISQILERPIGETTDKVFERWAKAAQAVGLTTVQTLRESMKRHEADIPEYVKQSIPIWETEMVRDAPIGRGVSINQLATILAAAEGEDKLAHFWNSLGFRPPQFELKVNAVAAVAREVLAK